MDLVEGELSILTLFLYQNLHETLNETHSSNDLARNNYKASINLTSNFSLKINIEWKCLP